MVKAISKLWIQSKKLKQQLNSKRENIDGKFQSKEELKF